MADDLEKQLDQLSDDLREQLSQVLREEAEKLSAAQRARLKELEQSPDETGNLEQSCTVVPGRDDLEWLVQAGGGLTTTEIRNGSGEPYDYSEAFEFGTSKQPARSFFWSTYRQQRPEIEKAINDAANEVLK